MAADKSPIDWALMPIKKYAQFSGRAPRAEYWWFYLGTIVATIVASIIDGILGFGAEGTFPVGPLYGLLALGLIIPSIAVTVRRLHDTNRSGWWILLPIAGYIVMIIVAGGALMSAMMGGTGEPGAGLGGMIIIGVLIALATFIVLFVFMVLRGTVGPNDYGPDPYGEHENLEQVFS